MMIPFIYETAVIADEIITASSNQTAAQGTDIVINGIPAKIIPSSMQINPVLDWSPITLANGTIGIPLWIFISAGFVLMFLYVILSWVFKLKRMNAVKGYVQAADKGTQEDLQVWIFGKTKKLTIECLKYWGGMIHYPIGVKITKWKHPSIMSTMNMGGQTAVAVSDDYDHTRDFISEIALVTACQQFNMRIEEIRKKFGAKIEPISCFKDYSDYGRKYLQMMLPDEILIDAYCAFDHTLFRKYFPKGRDGDLRGGIFLRKARKLRINIKDPSFWEKMLPLGITVIFVGIIMFAAMYAPIAVK